MVRQCEIHGKTRSFYDPRESSSYSRLSHRAIAVPLSRGYRQHLYKGYDMSVEEKKAKLKEKKRAYYLSTRERWKEYYRVYNYGLSVEEFERMKTQQGNQCAICKKTGHANDDVEILQAAIRYLEKWNIVRR
jgi:hypothetical protein